MERLVVTKGRRDRGVGELKKLNGLTRQIGGINTTDRRD